MNFPTPYTVTSRAYSQSAGGAHGPSESWGSPVEQAVYGWAPPSGDTEPFEAGRTAVVRDLDLYVPTAFISGPKDKHTVGGVEYRAVGHPQNFDHGPFGFMPGAVVHLERVEG